MRTERTIIKLTIYEAIVKIISYGIVDGKEYLLDIVNHNVYHNSVGGREDLFVSDEPQEIKDAIMAMWDNAPMYVAE